MASFRSAVDRIYRRLLGLYPGDFRAEYGDEMALLVRERSRDEPAVRLLVTLIADALTTAPREHFAMWSQDIRYALGMMARNPGFTLVAAGSLALGIGANTAIFSLADALLLRPLPIARPSEVVSIRSGARGASLGASAASVSYLDYIDYRDRARSFDGLVAYSQFTAGLALTPQAVPTLTLAMLVSGNTLRVLGVEPTLGRGFRTDEDLVPGRDAVAVLNHETWQRAFGADPHVLGRTLRLNGVTLKIVGVAPASFTGLDQYTRPAVFVPLAMAPALTGQSGQDLLARRNSRSLAVMGRLRAGVSITAAETELTTIAADLTRAYPESNRDQGVRVRSELQARFDSSPSDAGMMVMLLGLVACVLLIACANVANLLLSRAGSRAREMALRLAIGASRARLVRQLLTESAMLALLAGGLGVALGALGVRFFASVTIPTDLPIALAVRLDHRVLLVSVIASVASVIIFGLVPALKSTRTDLIGSLKAPAAGSGRPGRIWGRQALVVAQVALALILLAASLSLFRGFQRVFHADAGYRTDHLLLASFDPAVLQYTAEQGQAFYPQLLERARALPGAGQATLTSAVPMSTLQQGVDLVPEGFELPPGSPSLSAFGATVDRTYFATLRIPIVKGRGFESRDTASSSPVVVVNEEVARKYWAGQDPIGKRLRVGGADSPWLEVVGVARTHRYLWLGETPRDFVYLPFSQSKRLAMTLLLESTGDPALLAGPLREAARALDPNLPMHDVRTMEALFFMRAVGVPSMLVQTVGTMGAVGLSLAVMGLYALMAYSVGRRRREIGIRMAIGASRGAVLGMVLKQGLGMSAIGVAIGLAGSVGVVRLLAAGMPAVPSTDPVVFVVLPAALIAVTLLAILVPARRAAHVDPNTVLRSE